MTAGSGESDSSHVAYGRGMSEWCGACHGDYVNAANKHKVGSTNTLTATLKCHVKD